MAAGKLATFAESGFSLSTVTFRSLVKAPPNRIRSWQIFSSLLSVIAPPQSENENVVFSALPDGLLNLAIRH